MHLAVKYEFLILMNYKLLSCFTGSIDIAFSHNVFQIRALHHNNNSFELIEVGWTLWSRFLTSIIYKMPLFLGLGEAELTKVTSFIILSHHL